MFAAGAGTLIKPLTWQGDISFGPRRDGSPTVQRLDTNPKWSGIPELDDAGPRVIRRHFCSTGRQRSTIFSTGLGDGLSAGRKRINTWFTMLSDRLAAVEVEGTTMYVASQDVDALQASIPSDAVRFLPGHDQWVIGAGTKDVLVTPLSRRNHMTRKANPVIVGGVVKGV